MGGHFQVVRCRLVLETHDRPSQCRTAGKGQRTAFQSSGSEGCCGAGGGLLVGASSPGGCKYQTRHRRFGLDRAPFVLGVLGGWGTHALGIGSANSALSVLSSSSCCFSAAQHPNGFTAPLNRFHLARLQCRDIPPPPLHLQPLAFSEGWKVLTKGTAAATPLPRQHRLDVMIHVRLLESQKEFHSWGSSD